MNRPNYTGRMRCVCCACGDTYGYLPCLPEQDGDVSHGHCSACHVIQMQRIAEIVFSDCTPLTDNETPRR
jgi:hypothetical protein